MLTAVAFVPTPPLLVPELAGRAAEQTAELRSACLAAVRGLAEVSDVWLAIGADATDLTLGPNASGSWKAFGADVEVSLGPDAGATRNRELPLAALVAGWLRGQVAPEAMMSMRLYSEGTSAAQCAALGRGLAEDPEVSALLVLGDGCTTLTDKAPGAFDPRAADLQQTIDHGLSTADAAAVFRLDAGLCDALGVGGRVPWQVAAAAAGAGWRARSLYGGAPYGVGYQVAMWVR